MTVEGAKPPAWISWRTFMWAVVVALSAYYLYRALNFRFITPDQLGPSLLNKQLFYIGHLALALPILIVGPFQFSTAFRRAHTQLHRRMGYFYVVGASGAALTAIYLGATIEYEGSRLPIVIAASLWLFFTVTAWRCAVRKDFNAHRLFMIRSYVISLVLVWLRVLGDFGDVFFFYVSPGDVRDATQEWLSWVGPLLIMEFILTWLPLAKGRKTRAQVSLPPPNQPRPAKKRGSGF